jgi:hypothetical protein
LTIIGDPRFQRTFIFGLVLDSYEKLTPRVAVLGRFIGINCDALHRVTVLGRFIGINCITIA